MKKMSILFILLFSLVTFSNPLTLIFKDAVVNFVEMTPGSHELKEGQNVLWVEGSSSWKIKNNNYNFNFQIASLENIDNEIKEIDDNIFEIIGKNEILFYYSKLGKWAITDKSNLKYLVGGKTLEISSQSSVYVALYNNASWKMIYELYPDGKFSKNIEINNASNEVESNIYVVNDYLEQNIQQFSFMTRNLATEAKSTGFEENIINELYTLFIGKMKLDSEKHVLNIDYKKIISFEDYLKIPLSYSAKNQNPYKIRYIENTKNNGLGIEIPAGELWINESFDNNIIPLKKINIQSYSIGEKLSLNLDRSWNFNYSNNTVSDKKVNDEIRITQKNIILNNNSNDYKWVMIEESGPNVILEDLTTNDDYDTLINDSSKDNINIKIKLKPNTSINLNIIYKH